MMDELVNVSIQEVIMLGAQSLRMFGKLHFPKTMRQDSPQFHDEIGTALYSQSRFNAFEVFRGGAKTSLLRVFTAQRISYAISRTIMYVSASQAHSVLSVRWIKRQIMFNPQWAQTFGLRKGDKWTDEIIEIYHGVDDVPITILAMGITGQIRGFNIDDYRPDLIIMDDILTEENTGTAEQLKKIEDLIFGALLNSLAPSSEAPYAKAVFLQTPLASDDPMEKCLKDPQWHGLRFGVFDEHGKSRWEERFPTAQLIADKASATLRRQYALWMREMECQLVSGEDQTFDVERLQYYTVSPDSMTVVMAIDPASSEAKTADDQVLAVVGFHGPDVYVLDYTAKKGQMPDSLAMKFFEFALAYSPLRCAVESISYQRVLAWYLERQMEERRIYVVIDKVQDRRKKSDRIIQAIAGLLHTGHLHVRSSMTELVQQLDRYDPKSDKEHDDILDAIAMAITSVNPGMRTLEGDYTIIDDEEDYKPLQISRCP